MAVSIALPAVSSDANPATQLVEIRLLLDWLPRQREVPGTGRSQPEESLETLRETLAAC